MDENANVAEAAAWWNGRLDLGLGTYDAATIDGRYYNTFPPLWTLVSAVVLPFSRSGVPRWIYAVLICVPLPILAFVLFSRLTRTVLPAAVLSIAFLLGTSCWPVLHITLNTGWVWQTNHALSQIGLLILLLDYFGKRRIWVGALGLLVAVWSRTVTAIYVIPLLAAARVLPGAVRIRRVAIAAPVLLLTIALPLSLNALKFGNPLDSGYRYIYVGRSDPLALRAQHGLFALQFVPANLKHLLLGFPQFRRTGDTLVILHDAWGAGLWWTTPLLLGLLVDARAWWRDRDRRMLMTAVALIITTHLLYHNTGYLQPGYNRFSLDYMVVALAVLAPSAFSGRRGWISCPLVAWSVCYFHWVI